MKSRTVAIHLMLWSVYLLLYATLWRPSAMTFAQSLLRELFFLPVKLVLVYTCILYLVPRFLQNKKYLAFVGTTLVLMGAGGIIHNFYLHLVVPSDISALNPSESLFDWERITKRMTYLNSPVFFALTLVMVRNWYQQKEQNTRIIQENTIAKLQLLKAQLHPHFFFNTLNNLYSLALQKSDQTPAMILKLSELMRYLTEQHEKQWVTLAEEIQFLQNYIALEEVRYQDKVTVDWKMQVHNPDGILIAPLILSTFVENAFKHGVSDRVDTAYVHVEIEEDEQHLFFSVKNSKVTGSDSKPTGIGLSNLRNRLQLIYGSEFVLELHDGVSSYTASLRLNKRYETT